MRKQLMTDAILENQEMLNNKKWKGSHEKLQENQARQTVNSKSEAWEQEKNQEMMEEK